VTERNTLDELAAAFKRVRPQMVAFARRDADLDPGSRIAEFSDADVEQFVNAYEALFLEALAGSGRETRDLVLETALPPIVDLGQTSLDMVRSNAISAVMLTHRLLPQVSPERREDAARWLAAFYGGYAAEVVERVLALEAERRTR
jgi:hypothetical protein